MRRTVAVILSLALFVAASWLLFNRQLVLDYVSYWQYEPTSEIEELAAKTHMTQKGKFMFYVTHPKLDGTQAFNDECKRQEEGNAILGCYSKGRIFIYDIKDERLDGVREVTAAHEMLHAAYERLSASQRAKVDSELEAAYEKLANDDLKERMQYYARTEPGQRSNELHSILATEFSELTPALEEHFSVYFDDRQKVVELYGQYSGRFNELASNTSMLREKLEALSEEITQLSDQYNKDISSINSKIDSFNARAEAGNFSTREEFDSERSALLSEADALSETRDTITAKSREYERMRAEYNSLVDESNSMQKALDSSLAPAPSF